MKYNVRWRGENNAKRDIGSFEQMFDARNAAFADIRKNHPDALYVREVKNPSTLTLDYGSHTDFYDIITIEESE